MPHRPRATRRIPTRTWNTSRCERSCRGTCRRCTTAGQGRRTAPAQAPDVAVALLESGSPGRRCSPDAPCRASLRAGARDPRVVPGDRVVLLAAGSHPRVPDRKVVRAAQGLGGFGVRLSGGRLAAAYGALTGVVSGHGNSRASRRGSECAGAEHLVQARQRNRPRGPAQGPPRQLAGRAEPSSPRAPRRASSLVRGTGWRASLSLSHDARMQDDEPLEEWARRRDARQAASKGKRRAVPLGEGPTAGPTSTPARHERSRSGPARTGR